MKNKIKVTQEAEQLVRRVIEQSGNPPLDEETVRQVAIKIAKAVPPYPESKRKVA
jgi:hypothetical protein